MNINQEINSNEYKEHKIFETLNDISDFYNGLSFLVMHFLTPGTKSIINLDTYVYSSMKGTIDSIKILLINGRINDAFALLRKYYDSTIINIYSNLYLKENIDIENFVVEHITNWFENKDKLPSFKVMGNYIKQSQKMYELNKLIQKDDSYEKIRDRCNNHLHYNFFHYIMLNDNEVYIKDRIQQLNIIRDHLIKIFILHIAYIFYINEPYIMASDYIDYLELGMQPPEGCEKEIAPFVQEIFDKYLQRYRSDIATFIKESSEMNIN